MNAEEMLHQLSSEYRRIIAEDAERKRHQLFGVTWACSGCRAIVSVSGFGGAEAMDVTLRHESTCANQEAS